MGRMLSNLLGTLLPSLRIGKGVFDTSALTAQRTITVPDADITLGSTVFRGAMVRRSSNLTGVSWPILPIPFNAVVYDTGSIWNSTDNKFVIPAGVSYVRLTANVQFEDQATAGSINLFVANSSGGLVEGTVSNTWRSGTTGLSANFNVVHTPVLPVSEGDTFRLRGNASMVGQSEILAGSVFAIEFVA